MRAGDAAAREAARGRVDAAKVALGERGARRGGRTARADYNRRMAAPPRRTPPGGPRSLRRPDRAEEQPRLDRHRGPPRCARSREAARSRSAVLPVSPTSPVSPLVVRETVRVAGGGSRRWRGRIACVTSGLLARGRRHRRGQPVHALDRLERAADRLHRLGRERLHGGDLRADALRVATPRSAAPGPFTSAATTAKPLPDSPARAASMVAFQRQAGWSARRSWRSGSTHGARCFRPTGAAPAPTRRSSRVSAAAPCASAAPCDICRAISEMDRASPPAVARHRLRVRRRPLGHRLDRGGPARRRPCACRSMMPAVSSRSVAGQQHAVELRRGLGLEQPPPASRCAPPPRRPLGRSATAPAVAADSACRSTTPLAQPVHPRGAMLPSSSRRPRPGTGALRSPCAIRPTVCASSPARASRSAGTAPIIALAEEHDRRRRQAAPPRTP